MANVAKHCVLLLKRRDRQEWKWTAIENNYNEHDDDADQQYHYRYRYNRHCLCHYYFCFIFIIIIVRKQHCPCFTARTESIKSRFQMSCSLKNHALLLSYQRPWILNLSDLLTVQKRAVYKHTWRGLHHQKSEFISKNWYHVTYHVGFSNVSKWFNVQIKFYCEWANCNTNMFMIRWTLWGIEVQWQPSNLFRSSVWHMNKLGTRDQLAPARPRLSDPPQ